MHTALQSWPERSQARLVVATERVCTLPCLEFRVQQGSSCQILFYGRSE